jgi:Fe2+ transport system protein B
MPSDRKIIVESTEALSPHKKAVNEAGAALIKQSVETGREFCKSMIANCFAAIPVYVALIKLFVPEKKIIPDVVGLIWLLPIVLFLLAAAVFSAGYLPGHANISLDLPDEVEHILARSVYRRFWLGIIGFVLLSGGIVVGVGVLGSMGAR